VFFGVHDNNNNKIISNGVKLSSGGRGQWLALSKVWLSCYYYYLLNTPHDSTY